MSTLGLLVKCTKGEYAEKEFPEIGWPYTQPLIFEYNNVDTSVWRSLFISLSIKPDAYPYRNIYFHITIQTPSKKEVTEVKEFLLADELGNWFTEPDWRGICEFSSPIMVKTKFLEKGLYTFKLAQYMRDDTLKGVKKVSLVLDSSREK